ncbi:unnamed protein product, partial [marine sediment metagenome]
RPFSKLSLSALIAISSKIGGFFFPAESKKENSIL